MKARQVSCAICDSLFPSTLSRAKYCSPNCKRLAGIAARRRYYFRNQRQISAYHQHYYQLNKTQLAAKAHVYEKTSLGKRIRCKCTRNFNIAHPEKRSAYNAVKYALRSGALVKQPCLICGNPHAQSHHPDYSHPLIVTWLCFSCHRAWHRLLNYILQNILSTKGVSL